MTFFVPDDNFEIPEGPCPCDLEAWEDDELSAAAEFTKRAFDRYKVLEIGHNIKASLGGSMEAFRAHESYQDINRLYRFGQRGIRAKFESWCPTAKRLARPH